MKYNNILLLTITILTQGCHFIRPQIYDDTLYTSPNIEVTKTKIIPRRGATSAKQGPNYLLPLLHQQNEHVINGWDGKKPLETYLFSQNYILNSDGDDIRKFVSTNERDSVFLAKFKK
jgi:hypothetical protein